MATAEKKTSDTTRFDMRPAKQDSAGGSGLGILLLFMGLAVPSLLAITYLMMEPSQVPGQRLADSTQEFFEEVPLRRPPELGGRVLLTGAPEEHPSGLAAQGIEPAPEELLLVETTQRRAVRPRPLIPEEEPEWKLEIKEQMQKRISFDFVDTPLEDVVAFLTNLTNANMVLDPAAVGGDDVPVTLKVSDMKLEAVLDWILRLVNLSYVLIDEAIFISTADRLQELPSQRNMQIVYRAYDLREQLREDSREVLLDLIRNSLAADWEAPEAILAFVDGRLIIRHRWIVVRMVEKLMDEFLRASGVEPPEKPSPKTGASKAEVNPRLGATMKRELLLNGAVESERARRIAQNSDSLASFWANYIGSVKRGGFAWAKRLCLVDGLMKNWPEAEQNELTPADFDRLVRDVDVLEAILKRAENGFRFRIRRSIRYRQIREKLVGVENGLVRISSRECSIQRQNC